MCGIGGVSGLGDEEATRAVNEMLSAMRHRGPDGDGTLRYPGGAAGMVRLALVDPLQRSQQPMWSADGKVAILFNGEVYNFREERARLEKAGSTFRTTSDTEVVLALYLENGSRFVDRLRGMYAIAIYDFRLGPTPSLTLVRDPLGIKPLYVAKLRSGIAFASELNALLATRLVARELDPEAVEDFLAHGFVVQPRSILRGVRMLEPGTLELHDASGKVVTERFWSLPDAEPRPMSARDAAAELREILDESIRLHAFADAPVGAFLSGGIDSAIIVALMKQHVPGLRTYTLRFPDLKGMDEAIEARQTAQLLGVEHENVDVVGSEVAAVFPEFCASLDQPSSDGLNTWLVSRGAAKKVKGVLSGLGADEWFSGYPVARRVLRHQGLEGRLVRAAGRFAHAALQEAHRVELTGRVRDGVIERVERLAARRSITARWAQAHTLFSPLERARLLGRSGGAPVDNGMRFLGPGSRGGKMLSQVGMLDADVYMRQQLLRDSDVVSMAHSLELRVPFVDTAVAAFARRCPDELKLAGPDGVPKKVLIDALGSSLPDEVKSRPKRGFSLPIAAWMQGPLRPQIAELTGRESLRSRGLLNHNAVTEMFPASSPPARLFPRLYSLAVLESWCRGVLDVAPKRPATRDVA